ncbi:SGNH/GDSL hydrolase family protein [Leuconostoc pseudomesenteroides]|jgi:lysophospholipase L1-like esterase|uniref:SGNH/GDSL hydrolase family protein n=1 Tax=Leuconostoc TaxID=1243 RepID=UPI001907A698|nr:MULTISPECIES: SGNH/GDSL hydrolase family protein [Leuconostoc]MBK0039969.1 SGNH/GDSL hydrolase family protein [Leuconostoc sp. S51]MBK0050928.1 SGNH/GDSL hydrolase family protein [Leuconostoc sp. S50]MBS0956913.1 SGNH/GDSL hydrolase family protein [Leuconostoc pseudomesenteroides]MCT4381355.1 lysophospholipase [Leuconostoc pseudomesenteroides]MCT4412536.1 lysophospholipase [Leuconostoc pseudomesenteroides]
MRKVLISFIAIVIVGAGVLFGIKNWQHHSLNQSLSKTKKVSHINLVALGDSLTEGVGDTQKLQGYSGRIAKELREKYDISVTMKNFGKAGDRSDQIEKRLASQSDFQNSLKNADVLVMTVGGNDLQQLLLKNITASSPKALSEAVIKGKVNYQIRLAKLLKTVRGYNKQAPIFIFGNYNPLYVHFANREDFNDDVKKFNAINAKLATRDGNAYYVSSFDLTYGQFKTKSQRQKLVKQIENDSLEKNATKTMTAVLTGQTGVDNNWISKDDNYHPNNKGYQYMTSQLFHVMKREEKHWLIKH